MLKACESCRPPQGVKHYGTGCAGSLHTSGVKAHLSFKSLKSPIVLPSGDELVHLGKEGASCEAEKQQQPFPACSCTQVCAEKGPEGCSLCLTPWQGHLHLHWPCACRCCFHYPRNNLRIFWGVPDCKKSWCWAPVRGSAISKHILSYHLLISDTGQ